MRQQPPGSIEGTEPPRTGFRVIVAGGRGQVDRETVFAALDKADARRPIGYVIFGAVAAGEASLASDWARTRRRMHEVVRSPDWQRRNELMMGCRPEGVIAFPGGRAVADLVRRAQAAGLPVWQPYG